MKDLSERRETLRDQLRRHLEEGWKTALELSGAVRVPEKSIPDHLEHLLKSLAATGETLEVEPATCHGCGFVFKERGRFTRPSRCPKCKGERIESPRFRIPGTTPLG